MRTAKFWTGLLLGSLLAVAFWYWQKSTSAEEGALEVLDRLAAAEGRLKTAREQMAAAAPVAPPAAAPPAPAAVETAPDDLRQIEGIGPTYARRLHDAGIRTFAALASLSPRQVMELAGMRSQDTAVSWIAAASALSAS